MIRTSALRKTYRTGFWMRAVEAVKGVDLEVKTGEIFGLNGLTNGSTRSANRKEVALRLARERGFKGA